MKQKCRDLEAIGDYDDMDFDAPEPAMLTPYEHVLAYGYRYHFPSDLAPILEALDFGTEEEPNPAAGSTPVSEDELTFLINNRKYDKVMSRLNAVVPLQRPSKSTFGWGKSKVATNVTNPVIDEIFNKNAAGKTPLMACLRQGMTQEDCNVAHKIVDLDLSDDSTDASLRSICGEQGLDHKGFYPIHYAFRIPDPSLLSKMIESYPRAVQERVDSYTPYMACMLMGLPCTSTEPIENEELKQQLLDLLDYEGNNDKQDTEVEEPPPVVQTDVDVDADEDVVEEEPPPEEEE